ncbi:MAG TPA: hypothetical protein VH914_18305 [Acidimicrobiia bacterium]|nr:hypothetical protein [Acidimicrobiia bacterium]
MKSTVDESVYNGGGIYNVGEVTLTLAGGTPVDVWYPANGTVGVGSATYDVRDFLPAAIKQDLGKQHLYVGTDANRNVLVGAPGEVFPVVVLSHGTAGYRDEATYLTTRLASWGMIVAVPEDPSRDLAHALTSGASTLSPSATQVLATIALLQHENASASGPFKARVDLSRIAVMGIDSGVPIARAAALDARVDAYVAIAPPASSASSAGSASSASRMSSASTPNKPSLFVAGTADKVTPGSAATAQYGRAPAPSYEWLIDGAGHNAFTDVCVVAQPAGGLVKVLDSAGSGAMLSNPLVAQLTDGCAAPAIAPSNAWPLIDQVVTGFLKHFIGPDPAPVGVGPSGVRTMGGVSVTISQKAR